MQAMTLYSGLVTRVGKTPKRTPKIWIAMGVRERLASVRRHFR